MKLVLSTSNVMQGGPSIIRRHQVEKSNVELVASLRTNILAAQEAALEEDGFPNGTMPHRPPMTAWTSRDDGTIYVPSIDWPLSGLAEERNQYDITVKLFFLPHVSPACRRAQTLQAIDLVLRELRVPSIDLLILSFPNMAFYVKDEEGGRPRDCDEHQNGVHEDTGEVEDIGSMIKTWRTVEQLHAQGIIGRLGVAEFSSHRLEEFLKHTKIRPSANQINVRDCCTVPRSLMNFAKREQIELLTHNDCTNILPTGTLRELLGDGPEGVGFLAGPRSDGLGGEVEAQWVVKYTAVVRDRGVVENKGYFAMATLDQH
ncbi:MAG: hypothetical protein M1823_003947 [Watsoniomyces obsoletus]|nr:MAG: hypothetical protein M1823_003947 [Watsoniomyces obsoletus]